MEKKMVLIVVGVCIIEGLCHVWSIIRFVVRFSYTLVRTE